VEDTTIARSIAIGDIHGHMPALDALLAALDVRPDDVVIPLGDVVDRGPDSKGVVACLLALEERCTLRPVMGNHEEMLLAAYQGLSDRRFWLKFGGREALASYGPSATVDDIPWKHREFLSRFAPYVETETHIFVHAGYMPGLPMSRQPSEVLRWNEPDWAHLTPHVSGKVVVAGHVRVPPEILDLGFFRDIDTGCGFPGGCLTALDVTHDEVVQVDPTGRVRRWRLPVRIHLKGISSISS
jgi:serine/threonine protein phosphatase 1